MPRDHGIVSPDLGSFQQPLAVDLLIPAIYESMETKPNWKDVFQKYVIRSAAERIADVTYQPPGSRLLVPYAAWDASGSMSSSWRREQHSADWTCWIGPEGSSWRVCFRSVLLDLLPTREQARIRIRQYKADPTLAICAEIQLS